MTPASFIAASATRDFDCAASNSDCDRIFCSNSVVNRRGWDYCAVVHGGPVNPASSRNNFPRHPRRFFEG